MHFIVHAALMRIKLMIMMIAVCCILANNIHLIFYIGYRLLWDFPIW